MRLYLAHPIIHRHEVRKEELLFERITDVDLLNPFYDTDREDIGAIDNGRTDRFGVSLDIVENDIKLIQECDGLLYVPCGHESVGSAMEIAYAHHYSKPVYIIEAGELSKHIWLRYHATATYPTWKAFAEQLRPRRGGTTTEEMVRSVCESLGTYTYHEVRNALMKQTKVQENKKVRGNVGCYVPTERQLQYMLSRAEWSKETTPPSKHKPATYAYGG